MKIERLIGIVIYLINRKMVTASQLADHFDVSKRTILRDMNVLTLAGIPIYAENGSKGGYAISPNYRLNEKIIDLSNTQYMLLALKSLQSVYGETKVSETYEKIKHVYDAEIEESHIDIDFSVVRENESVILRVSELRTAMVNKQTITFDYTNQKGQSRQVEGNLIHVFYKWYAWYAFVHDLKKDRNLMFKVVRMDNVVRTDTQYTSIYDVQDLLEAYNQANESERIDLVIEYAAEYEKLVAEYFGGQVVESQKPLIRRRVAIQENDFNMFSLILGFGDKLEVISPMAYRNKVISHLKETLEKNYSNGDT